jgi:hypothetical protein
VERGSADDDDDDDDYDYDGGSGGDRVGIGTEKRVLLGFEEFRIVMSIFIVSKRFRPTKKYRSVFCQISLL